MSVLNKPGQQWVSELTRDVGTVGTQAYSSISPGVDKQVHFTHTWVM